MIEDISTNNNQELTTNANGLATLNIDLHSTGWSSFSIDEVKINRSDASKYLKLVTLLILKFAISQNVLMAKL